MALEANQVTAVNKMLRDLGRAGIKFYGETSYPPWQRLVVHHRAITGEAALDALLPSHENRVGTLAGHAIPLVPSKRSNGAAALLRVEWDFDSEPWMLKYYLLLYYGAAAGAKPALGMSFRLEQPEGGGKPSTHDYWHIQLCRSVASDRGTEVLACHDLTPVSYPAFPLNADNAVSLTASVPLALSGRPALMDVITGLTGQGPFQRELTKKYANVIA